MQALEEYLTFNEVMKKYGKTLPQIRYAVTTGRLPEPVKVGWSILFLMAQLPESWPEAPRNKKKGDKT